MFKIDLELQPSLEGELQAQQERDGHGHHVQLLQLEVQANFQQGEQDQHQEGGRHHAASQEEEQSEHFSVIGLQTQVIGHAYLSMGLFMLL